MRGGDHRAAEAHWGRSCRTVYGRRDLCSCASHRAGAIMFQGVSITADELNSGVVPAQAGTHNHRLFIESSISISPVSYTTGVMGPGLRRDDQRGAADQTCRSTIFSLRSAMASRRVEALRAGLRAVHDGVAAIQPERIFQDCRDARRWLRRSGQQRGGAEEAVAVPPVARARGRAAGAQDTFVKTVELAAVFRRLLPFLLRRRSRGVQPRLDGGVLRVEVTSGPARDPSPPADAAAD